MALSTLYHVGQWVPTVVDLTMGGTKLTMRLTDPQTDPGAVRPTPFTFTDLGLTGTVLDLAIRRTTTQSYWTFLTEVSFQGWP